jgi:HK97 family phage portal protein
LYDWKHQMLSSLLLRGNAYGLVIRNTFGKLAHIVWIPPAMVTVDELTSPLTPIYAFAGDERQHINVAQGGDILHLRAYTVPGTVVALSPVGLFRKQFEMARGALMTAHQFYEGRAIPGGILKSEVKGLDHKVTDEAKERFTSAVSQGGVVALDANWSWEQVSLSASDAAFLDTIQATSNQIAAMYRVEPEDVGGEPGHSLKYTTVEGNQRKFNTRTLMPWATRIEYALPPVLAPGVFMKHNFDALARPNLLELNRSISEELRNGTLTLPEARALRDRRPLTEQEIDDWQEWYATTKSQSESDATSLALTQPQGD